MMLLLGTRRTTRVLGRIARGCARCRQQAWFQYARTTSTFTFFFIPLIPLGSTTRAVCSACGFQQVVPEAVANQALAMNAARALPNRF